MIIKRHAFFPSTKCVFSIKKKTLKKIHGKKYELSFTCLINDLRTRSQRVVIFLTNSTLLTTEHDEILDFYVHKKQLLYYFYQYKMVCKHETSSLKNEFLHKKNFSMAQSD